ncbi:MAG: pseudouridine synthase [Rudaea sp.]
MTIKRNPSPLRRHRDESGKPARHELARVLSKLGICSRTQASVLIEAGRVSVDGRVIRDPEKPVDATRETITLDEAAIGAAEKVYIALNKPRGYVTTARDEHERATVYDLLREKQFPGERWIAPVGRLDKASEGLLLLTNDSAWAARITDPATHVEKTYHVQVNAIPDDALLRRLREGVDVDESRLAFKSVRELRRGEKNAWLEIALDEGRNRQIRRLLAEFDVSVLRLIRVAIGALPLGDLAKGNWRHLTGREIAMFGASDR